MRQLTLGEDRSTHSSPATQKHDSVGSSGRTSRFETRAVMSPLSHSEPATTSRGDTLEFGVTECNWVYTYYTSYEQGSHDAD